jgi:hypothetical protein
MKTKYFMLKDSEPVYSIFYAVSENRTVAVCADAESPFITCYDNNTIIYDIEDFTDAQN